MDMDAAFEGLETQRGGDGLLDDLELSIAHVLLAAERYLQAAQGEEINNFFCKYLSNSENIQFYYKFIYKSQLHLSNIHPRTKLVNSTDNSMSEISFTRNHNQMKIMIIYNFHDFWERTSDSSENIV